ncbi:MAG: hypothetical protein C0596_08985 [Marinilabiliales bacterium]|nr:MAG: hypothetical protein C0596_08985 [Marinilabiliales bacterium]
MKTVVRHFIVVLIFGSVISCSNQQRTNTKESANTQKEEEIHDSISTKEDSIELKSDTVINSNIIQNETEFKVKYLEDFASFKSHDEVVDYFGEENVAYELQMFGAGWESYSSVIYPKYQNQVMIVWNDFDPDEELFFVSQYKHYDAEQLEQGGANYPYKSGLKNNMGLDELVELNGGDFEFNDLSWDLGRQFIVGIIIKEKLKPELQDYIIHLDYANEVDYDNQPADFKYLHNYRIVSTDDDNIITKNLKVVGIMYSPCRCTVWY